VEISINTTQPS